MYASTSGVAFTSTNEILIIGYWSKSIKKLAAAATDKTLKRIIRVSLSLPAPNAWATNPVVPILKKPNPQKIKSKIILPTAIAPR